MMIHLIQISRYQFNRIAIILFFVFGVLGAVSAAAVGEEIDTATAKEIYLIKGELVNLKASGLERISVTQPEIADILNADEEEILMVGQSVGQTTLFIWDELGKRSLTVHVLNQDLKLIKERLEALFKKADITEVELDIDSREGKVVLLGNMPAHKKERFTQIVDKFGDDVLNFVKDEEIEDLIQVAVQITELSSTLSKSLGVDWTNEDGDELSFAYPETLPAMDGSVNDYFKIGDFALIDLKEAFASRGLACLRQLGVADDAEHVNPHGGAIALGHPLGMSGARLALTAAHGLETRGGRLALATMCVGVGQGVSLALERV